MERKEAKLSSDVPQMLPSIAGIHIFVISLVTFAIILCIGMFNISKMKNRPMILIGG